MNICTITGTLYMQDGSLHATATVIAQGRRGVFRADGSVTPVPDIVAISDASGVYALPLVRQAAYIISIPGDSFEIITPDAATATMEVLRSSSGAVLTSGVQTAIDAAVAAEAAIRSAADTLLQDAFDDALAAESVLRSAADAALQSALADEATLRSAADAVLQTDINTRLTQAQGDARYFQLASIISDAQHGTRAGGNLHALASNLVAGFMSAADKIKLDFLTIAAATVLNGGGTINLAGSTLTIPATGTVALLGLAQTFTADQRVEAILSVRGDGPSANVAGLYVPWLSGDTKTTARFGKPDAGNNQIALSASSDSSVGVSATSNSKHRCHWRK